MGWWSALFRRAGQPQPADNALPPILMHCHSKDALPPGPLEEGMIEMERDDMILHAVAGIVQPDGTIGELPSEKLEWARRLVYRHFKREGCLAEFGIPIIPAYEVED
jgi:hypothetical protein